MEHDWFISREEADKLIQRLYIYSLPSPVYMQQYWQLLNKASYNLIKVVWLIAVVWL